MPQSENIANNVLFIQEHKNSIMVKQWTFYPPNREIRTLNYPPNLNKIILDEFTVQCRGFTNSTYISLKNIED